MGILDEARDAARQAREQRGRLRQRIRDAWYQARGMDQAPPEEPPTLIVDAQGHARVEGEFPAMTLLGRSALLLAASAALAGLTWMAVFFLALYLLLRRLFPWAFGIPPASPVPAS